MKKLVYLLLVILLLIFLILYIPSTTRFSRGEDVSDTDLKLKENGKKEEIKITHIKTPEPLKGVYMTACIASRPDLRKNIVKLVDETEINAIVIDIKDATGVVSFQTGNLEIDNISNRSKGCRVDDMKEFIGELHDKNIYVIGRVAVFQDPLYTKLHPELAVRSKSTGGSWKDRKDLSFIDVGAKPYWSHVLAIATSSYAAGFD